MGEPLVHDEDLQVWLKSAKAVLLAAGFRREVKQWRKANQVWGLVRQEPDEMQLHVRAFTDGRLESEVELSNKFVQHLWSHRRNAHPEIAEILNAHGLPTERISETFAPKTGTQPGKVMPKSRTKTNHAIAASVVALGLLVGRKYIQHVILRKR